MMLEIITFTEALEESGDAKRYLLLGNGFSISCDPNIFHYNSLYEKAKPIIKEKMPEVLKIFEKLSTKDFEAVIRTLEGGATLFPIYSPTDKENYNKILENISQLKEILASTIATNHPDKPTSISSEKFFYCRQFLFNFLDPINNNGKVYTLNYDLLLYWTLMNDDWNNQEHLELAKNDGCGKEEPDSDYVIWKNDDHSRDQNIYYLHGAVHLFDSGDEVEKYTWKDKGIPLIEQTRAALQSNKFPLFVAEGKSRKKLTRIKHHIYLGHGYRSFLQVVKERKSQPKSLFIFGHSLRDEDDHIILEISKGSISKVFIGIHGDPQGIENKKTIAKGKKLENLRSNRKLPLKVKFFDSATARVWG